MKTLTLKQPWAWAVIHTGKDVENRTWPTKHRGPLAIHAARATPDLAAVEWIESTFGLTLPREFDCGGIVGQVEVTDCLYSSTTESLWVIPHQWHWFLANAKETEFRPCKGRLGIWESDGGAK